MCLNKFYWLVWTFWKNNTQCCDIQWECFSEAVGSSRVVGQIQNLEHSRRTHLCLLRASSSKWTLFSSVVMLGKEKVIHGNSVGIICFWWINDETFICNTQIPISSNPLRGAHVACFRGVQNRFNSVS